MAGKDNVVIVPFGKGSLHSDWIFNEEEREFDVILLFYHDVQDQKFINNPAFTVYRLMQFKWVMVQQLFNKTAPGLLDSYGFFFFIDDDIEITKNDINRLFRLMRENQLDLSQPTLTGDSFKSWRALRRKHFSGIRYVSAVELMLPMMSRRAVVELLPTFALNQSGWGIDILWGKTIREKFGPKSIAVFDNLRARHGKPVGKGELYARLGKPAQEERDLIFSQYAIQETRIVTLKIPENRFINRVKSYFQMKRAT